MAAFQQTLLLGLEGGSHASRRQRAQNASPSYSCTTTRAWSKKLPAVRGLSSEQVNPPQQQQQQEESSNVPSWAQPGASEPPPWERNEAVSADTPFEIPFYAYLLSSVIVAIAAIGSIFEYFNKKPIFGVILPDSPLYAPILGFFVFAGFPTSAFLWFKSIAGANKAARDQDREDGYID